MKKLITIISLIIFTSCTQSTLHNDKSTNIPVDISINAESIKDKILKDTSYTKFYTIEDINYIYNYKVENNKSIFISKINKEELNPIFMFILLMFIFVGVFLGSMTSD